MNNEEAFKKNIDRANYNSDQKKKILDLIEKAKKDGKLDENDAAMLQVLMSGQTPSNLKDAKDIIA